MYSLVYSDPFYYPCVAPSKIRKCYELKHTIFNSMSFMWFKGQQPAAPDVTLFSLHGDWLKENNSNFLK